MQTLNEIGLKYTAHNFNKGKLYTGGDKTSLGNNFTEEYALLFEPIRESKMNLLELGVLCGKSLAMWSDYFSKANIYGIDIRLKNYYDNQKDLMKHGAFKNNNVKVIEADVTSENFKELLEELPMFDIIIDDALHKAHIQFNNFMRLFDKLNSGGFYIIEDIIEPESFFNHFGDIIKCSMNVACIKQKQNKNYSIACKIEYIKIKQNMFIIKKQ
jgi:hypothetical protein